MRSFKFFRWMSAVLVLTVAATTISAPARAAMIATPDAAAVAADRQRVEAFLERSDVAARLQALGVRPEDARARVAALSDEEVSELAGHMQTLPAGGFLGEIVGAAVLVFLVLLLTDILGFTHIFPFTKPIK